MNPKITQEMREALHDAEGGPVVVEDESGHGAYYLVAQEHAGRLFREWLKREYQVGLDDIDAGGGEEWTAASVQAEGRRILKERAGEK